MNQMTKRLRQKTTNGQKSKIEEIKEEIESQTHNLVVEDLELSNSPSPKAPGNTSPASPIPQSRKDPKIFLFQQKIQQKTIWLILTSQMKILYHHQMID